TTDAGQITLITGWNFYAGRAATQIGSGQYDFETVVTHELGHALGLGHSTDSTSVMYATLNTGTLNRTLTTAHLNVADSDTSGACGLHAAVAQVATSLTATASASILSPSLGQGSDMQTVAVLLGRELEEAAGAWNVTGTNVGNGLLLNGQPMHTVYDQALAT